MIHVLYQDPDFIVVNKPPNISVQNEPCEQGIVTVLCRQLDIPTLWLVHRLDKITTGCLLLARNKTAASLLSQAFQAKQVDK